jgi:hypothetical protein
MAASTAAYSDLLMAELMAEKTVARLGRLWVDE